MLQNFKETVLVRAFALAKIPLLYFARPKVIRMTDDECVISLPFSRMNKNHLGSLYFGAFCMGADAAGGLIAMRALQKVKKGKVSLIFKDFQAKFLKRAEGETYFTCKDGAAIHEAVKKTSESSERVDLPVHVTATVPKKFGDEPVAEFILTLSLKVKR
jgi:acyl-coenzyme A thioesterase PaaI-like protein